ncbi:Imm1 family immunity protein [Actinokineospora pegani]|uniref:Imm1 family immunity protein n=1 Tax=Actinokineospora pegani TaxID=2654637 RepID=UPI0012EAFE9E|nr:Imm1 family immunity protein [Actinokineospora pegani]
MTFSAAVPTGESGRRLILAGPCVGDPDSPALLGDSEFGFPAGSGLPIAAFRAVLVEFVHGNGVLPTAVEWTDEDSALYRRPAVGRRRSSRRALGG